LQQLRSTVIMVDNNISHLSVPAKCIRCANKVPVVCLFSNLTLALFKMIVGWLTYSRGLFADGIHSLCDVIGNIGVIISLNISSKGVDEKYPYGRGKIEFISCIFVYSVLFIVAIFILASAIIHIIQGNLRTPSILSLFSALVSVFANMMLYRLAICAGKAINSPAIIADANENKADMLSSIAVIVGITGCHLGFKYSDVLSAIFVGLIILQTAVTLGWKAIQNLLDTSIPVENIKLINRRILTIEQVKRVNYIKTRRIGKHYQVDVEILLSPILSIREGDEIAEAVKHKIMKISNKIRDVVIIKACELPNEKESIKLLKKEEKLVFSG